MTTVMCYGDSNTWGSDPADEYRRFPADVRWPGALRAATGWDVVEEGLGGRTTAFDRLPRHMKNGRDMLAGLVDSHAPLDAVVILLGTNDVSLPYLSAEDIARGAGELVGIVQRSDDCGPDPHVAEAPKVLLVAPPVVGPLLPEDVAICPGVPETSRRLGAAYERIAGAMRCGFLDLAPVVTTSPLDGWHWESEQHTVAGRAVAEALRELLAV